MDGISSVVFGRGSLGSFGGLGDLQPSLGRCVFDHGCGELHHDDFEHASSGDDHASSSFVRLVGLDHGGLVVVVFAGLGGCDHDVVDGS